MKTSPFALTLSLCLATTPMLAFSCGEKTDDSGDSVPQGHDTTDTGACPGNTTLDNPGELVVGQSCNADIEPYRGGTDENGVNHYWFVPASDGAHTIALTKFETDLDWEFHLHPSFYDEGAFVCDTGDVTSSGDEICSTSDFSTTLVADTPYYLRVRTNSDEYPPNQAPADNYDLLITLDED